jgi:Co/Zn/Cd efflux system component
MHHHTLHDWRHDHVFLGEHHPRHERRTWLVVGLTAAMMVAEIVAGTIFGSMALVADGWHMSTHAAAIAIAALAYRFARKHAHNPPLLVRHRQGRRARGVLQRDYPGPHRPADRL